MFFLKLLFWIITYTFGISCISIQLIGLYKKIENKERLFFQLAFLLLIITMIFYDFFSPRYLNDSMSVYLIHFAALLVAFTLPLCINSNFNSKKIKFVAIINKTLHFLLPISIAVMMASIIFSIYSIFKIFIISFFMISTLYSIIINQLNMLKKSSAGAELITKIGSFLSFFFLPSIFIIDDVLVSISEAKSDIPEGYYSIPISFICLCVFTMYRMYISYKNTTTSSISEKDPSVIKNEYLLSDRELEVLKLLIGGRSYKQIGESLYISCNTVKAHISKIYRKTDTKNKIELINLLAAT